MASGPRWRVGRKRKSTVLRPATTASARGCRKERAFMAASLRLPPGPGERHLLRRLGLAPRKRSDPDGSPPRLRLAATPELVSLGAVLKVKQWGRHHATVNIMGSPGYSG